MVEPYQEKKGKDVRELTTAEKFRTGVSLSSFRNVCGFEISGMRFNITIVF